MQQTTGSPQAERQSVFERLNVPVVVLAGIATIVSCVLAALALLNGYAGLLTDRLAQPKLRVDFHIAASPNLTAAEDRALLERAGIKVSVLRTAYRDRVEAMYNPNLDRSRYLFLWFTNEGNVVAQDIRARVRWTPELTQNQPDDINYPGTFGPLIRDEERAFALLVDVAQKMPLSSPFSTAHFSQLCVTLDYTNEAGTRFTEDWCLQDSTQPQGKASWKPIFPSNMQIR